MAYCVVIYINIIIHDHPALRPASAIPNVEGGTSLDNGLFLLVAVLRCIRLTAIPGAETTVCSFHHMQIALDIGAEGLLCYSKTIKNTKYAA